MTTTRTVNRHEASLAISQLMPSILRGVQLDFFINRKITQTQLLVLMAIHGHGRCCMGTLAENLHVRMPTATGIVGRLVRSGFVHRFPCAEDRRQVLVELTPKGREFIYAFQSVIRRRWEEVLRLLNPQELAAFHHAIQRLHTQMQPRS
ncbi:MAG: hypothetical protein COV75_00705 [Candidatus Omnitrophica bacterium CG11_big_fil_rev_8_21_14_0_20_63_9]|nr:MAG: hypothetical protein COV75_00705 [Candidatus Omnitrophica bacterium CG11_big_fil_rev_8_21_14_0_20_63_9]